MNYKQILPIFALVVFLSVPVTAVFADEFDIDWGDASIDAPVNDGFNVDWGGSTIDGSAPTGGGFDINWQDASINMGDCNGMGNCNTNIDQSTNIWGNQFGDEGGQGGYEREYEEAYSYGGGSGGYGGSSGGGSSGGGGFNFGQLAGIASRFISAPTSYSQPPQYYYPPQQQPRYNAPASNYSSSNYSFADNSANCVSNSCNTSTVTNINTATPNYQVAYTPPTYYQQPIAYVPPAPTYYPPTYVPPVRYPTLYPSSLYCTLTASRTSISNGDSTFLSWSSSAGVTSATLSDGLGYAAPNGTIRVSPEASRYYTLTVYGNGTSATCGTMVSVTGAQYVALNQIPYTGFDFGTLGNTMYWLVIMALALLGAYGIVYFRGGAQTVAAGLGLKMPARAVTRSEQRAEAAPAAARQGIQVQIPRPARLSNFAQIVHEAQDAIVHEVESHGHLVDAAVATGTADTMRLESNLGEMPRLVITRA